MTTRTRYNLGCFLIVAGLIIATLYLFIPEEPIRWLVRPGIFLCLLGGIFMRQATR
jgi:hypothetical protein